MRGRTYARKGQQIPYAPKTIANIHGGIISPALSWAARKRDIPIEVNPCIGVILPTRPRRTVTLNQVPTGLEIGDWIAIAYEVSQLASRAQAKVPSPRTAYTIRCEERLICSSASGVRCIGTLPMRLIKRPER